MIVLTLARKPVSGTVAANAVAHGTGGLCIAGSRVGSKKMGGYTVSMLGKGVWTPDNCGLKKDFVANEGVGRWPANLILQHRPSCQQDGVKKVRGHGFGETIKAGDFGKSGIYGKAKGAETQTYADAEGFEEVEAWACTAACHVPEFDQQSEGASRFFKQVKG